MQLSYTYHSIPIPGGGFVTGFVFHPRVPGICYARTDVGGVYRLNRRENRWIPLMDWVGHPHEGLMQTLSIALDPDRPGRVMVLSGNEWPGRNKPGQRQESALLISEDYGEHWEIRPVPFAVNGNGPSRSCMEKLAFVRNRLYYASPNQGLFMSEDLGRSWVGIPVPNPHLVFVKADPLGRWLLISTTGEPEEKGAASGDTSVLNASCSSERTLSRREHSLYLAAEGQDFLPLPLPAWPEDAAPTPGGYVAVSCGLSDGEGTDQLLYITLSGPGRQEPAFPYWNFCCECGGGTHGKLLRYRLNFGANQKGEELPLIPQDFEDLTPSIPGNPGICGVAVSGDLVYCSTIHADHNYIYRSMDGGAHFTRVLDPRDTSLCDYTVPYMKPEYNNGLFLVHWISCLALDPFNRDFLLFNTGTGIFACSHAASPGAIRFAPLCGGLEETVHLNLYAPPAGPVRVLDIVGDLGGFAFRDISRPCENSFADEQGNRYITCNNADYTDKPVTLSYGGRTYPDAIPYLSTARGNWRGVTKGGLILSLDYCESFMRLPMPFGLSRELDEVCRRMEEPNVNAGWCALSADGQVLLWSPARDWFHLPASLAVRTEDWGGHYSFAVIFGLEKNALTDTPEIKFFSDRVNPSWFYGFGEAGQVYISTDAGRTFYEYPTPEDFPKGFYFSGVDGMKRGEIRPEPGRAGSIYLAAEAGGLWHLSFDGSALTCARLTESGDIIFRVGLGKGTKAPAPALFVSGSISGEYGLYKKPSPDTPWIRISTDKQHYGSITSITGDMNREGVVYIATGGRGIFAGEPPSSEG